MTLPLGPTRSKRNKPVRPRIVVVHRLATYGWTYGVQARIAEELGVSDATISRDLKAILSSLHRMSDLHGPSSHEAMDGAGAPGSGADRWSSAGSRGALI
ncbi:MAG: HTH domain-containing protein [Actinobacteria bacterium]|nr:MAG: HTH domain-containing protein [Actinomycetota bacterium]